MAAQLRVQSPLRGLGQGLRTMTNVNQAPFPRLSKAPLVRASLVKRRYIKYLALPFLSTHCCTARRPATSTGCRCHRTTQFAKQIDLQVALPQDAHDDRLTTGWLGLYSVPRMALVVLTKKLHRQCSSSLKVTSYNMSVSLLGSSAFQVYLKKTELFDVAYVECEPYSLWHRSIILDSKIRFKKSRSFDYI